MKNQNIEKLTEKAKDIIQAVFTYQIGAAHGLTPDAIEVKLDDDVSNLLNGSGTVHFHALGDIENYLQHREDDEWAIIFFGYNIGDAEKGRNILESTGMKIDA